MNTKTSFFAGINHTLSGLNTTGSVSRDLNEESFLASSITVLNVEEPVLLGEVVAASYVFLKNISGSDLRVGTVSGAYPFRLKQGDVSLLPLDTDGKFRERSTVSCNGDNSGSLSGKHFDMADVSGPVRVWFSTDIIVPSTTASGSIIYGVPAAAYATTAATAFGSITFTGYEAPVAWTQSNLRIQSSPSILPPNGSTTTIGGVAYKWLTTLTGSPNEIKIPASASNTLTNLNDAINRNSFTAGLSFSYVTEENPVYYSTISGSDLIISARELGVMPSTSVTTPFTLTVVGAAGAAGSSVTVSGVEFRKVVLGASTSELRYFISISELQSKINSLPGVAATRSDLVISITADSPGSAGNLIPLSKSGTGLAVSGSGFLSGGVTGETFTSTSVSVGASTYTYVATSPTGNQFSTIADLTFLINSQLSVNATHSSGVIAMTAALPGVTGNLITLSKDVKSAGTTSVSAATLTGGADTIGSNVPATPLLGRLIQVPIQVNDSAATVAGKLSTVISADPMFSASVTGDTVTIDDDIAGVRAFVTDVNTGFVFSRAPVFSGQITVFMKSMGRTEVLVGVAPH